MQPRSNQTRTKCRQSETKFMQGPGPSPRQLHSGATRVSVLQKICIKICSIWQKIPANNIFKKKSTTCDAENSSFMFKFERKKNEKSFQLDQSYIYKNDEFDSFIVRLTSFLCVIFHRNLLHIYTRQNLDILQYGYQLAIWTCSKLY